MSDFQLIEAGHEELEGWDQNNEQAINGTLFHSRNFLSYHGSRFQGTERFLVGLSGEKILVQISFALFNEPDGYLTVRSPFGGSYGGFVWQEYPSLNISRVLLHLFVKYLKSEGISRCFLCHPTTICSNYPLDTFFFALQESGFQSYSRDICNVMPLQLDKPIQSMVANRARRARKKAINSDIRLELNGSLDDFWQVLKKNFTKHNTASTHSKSELQNLLRLEPTRISVSIAYHNGSPIAGLCCFDTTPFVRSAFYICQDPNKQNLQGLTALMLAVLEKARKDNLRWFDFGTSSVAMQARDNIFAFKENFSKIGVFRETYKLEINEAVSALEAKNG